MSYLINWEELYQRLVKSETPPEEIHIRLSVPINLLSVLAIFLTILAALILLFTKTINWHTLIGAALFVVMSYYIKVILMLHIKMNVFGYNNWDQQKREEFYELLRELDEKGLVSEIDTLY